MKILAGARESLTTIIFAILLHFWSEPFIDFPTCISTVSRPASWVCDVFSHTGPHAQKGLRLGLMFGSYHLEILN